MGFEALLASFLAARRATQRSDIFFATCIAGSMGGLLRTLTTLWMGPPLFSLFFCCWAGANRSGRLSL